MCCIALYVFSVLLRKNENDAAKKGVHGLKMTTLHFSD